MRIAVLGPLVVTGEDGPVAVTGDRLRTLIIRLALDAGRPVRADALIDDVWSGQPPAGAANALQTLVSRLRRVLPADVLTGDATGYRLTATVDIDEFAELVRAGRAAPDASAAVAHLGAALDLWRGPALADAVDAPFAGAPAARLDEARIDATEEWLAARVATQPVGALIGELETFAAEHPLRERTHALLIEALATAGRQADAVRAYERIRARLADQLGLDPSADLAAAYTGLLRGERTGNLRPALTSFVGRDADVARVTAMIREHPLVTLVGPGGAGKTRLATEAARALAGEFDGGVWIVELAPIREADGVARALADTLQIQQIRFLDLSAKTDPLDRLLNVLAAKDVLLILDNCEHLIDASARTADALLAAGPGLRIVATSREPLAITGEALCPVGPLPIPALNATAAAASSVASVRLFADRARAVKPGFAVTDANAAAVGEICRRLDGMPLAIELACARLRTMPVEAIADRLDDRFRLLTGGSRTALPRHQTLQAVVEWTWELLSEPERSLAARLSVFLDGASVDTIVGVCGADAVEPLAGLVDKSFVILGDDGRYRMLETIRSYAAERLTDIGPAAAARTAHASYFATTAEYADDHVRRPEQVRWLKWMSDERDNLAGALRWAIDSRDASTAVRLAGALGWFWLLCDYHVEALAWLGQALALPGEVPDAARALALAHYGVNLLATDEAAGGEVDDILAQARALGSEHPIVALSEVMSGMFADDFNRAGRAMVRLRDHPDPWVQAMGTTVDAILHIFTGDAATAESGLTDALARFEAIGDYWARATLSSALGEIRSLRGDRAGAVVAFRSAASLAAELGVPEVTAGALMSLSLHEARTGDLRNARLDLERADLYASRGVSPQLSMQLRGTEAEIAWRGGDLVGARALYSQVVAQARTARAIAREIIGGLMHGLALTEIALGDLAAGRALAVEIYEIATAIRGRMGMSMCATICLTLADVTDRPLDAAYLIGVGDAVRGVTDMGTPEVTLVVDRTRERLGEAAYQEAVDRGRALDLPSAMAALGSELSVR